MRRGLAIAAGLLLGASACMATGYYRQMLMLPFLVALVGVAILAGGCSTITVRNTGSGTVNVHQTRVVSTDASIPASVIP